MKKSRLDDLILKQENLSELNRNILEEIQLKKLNALLQKEKERQGFYASLPASLSSLKELSSLPFTTADDLRQYYPQLFLGSSSRVEKVLSEKTSGTTGAAKRIFYSKDDLAHTISFFAAGIGEMTQPDDTVMIGMPYTGPGSLGDLIASGVRECKANPVQLCGGSLYEQCRHYHQVQPACAIDLPVALLAKARCYEYLYGRGSFPLRAALPSADACCEAVERALREEFGLSLFPHYGSREMCMGGAITCPAHAGMHLREHQVFGEIIDENGHVLPDGEWGELVITTVDMQVLPLIRFRTGDHTRFLKEPCPCGSVTRRLDQIRRIGKDAEILAGVENAFFSFRSVLDLSLTEKNGAYQLGLLLRDAAETDAIQKTADAQNLIYDIRIIKSDDNLLYSGKRFIHHI